MLLVRVYNDLTAISVKNTNHLLPQIHQDQVFNGSGSTKQFLTRLFLLTFSLSSEISTRFPSELVRVTVPLKIFTPSIRDTNFSSRDEVHHPTWSRLDL